MKHLLAALLLLVTPVLAQAAESPQTAIAMHGTPKYAPDFAALDYVNPEAPKGGTLKLSFTGTFDNINPYSVRGTLAAGLGWGGPSLTGESLLYRAQDEPFTLYGLIAQSVRLPEDRSWIEFHLNPAAYWNDGTPLTVDDVLFSWATLKEKGRPNHRNYYSKVATARQTGPHDVRFDFDTTKTIDREMPLILGLMPILQKAWWSGRDVSAPLLENYPTSGPYRLESFEAGRRLVYVKDDNWWGRDLPINRGQWNFARITYDYYRDRNVAGEAFKAHAFDLKREQDPRFWLTGYQGPALSSGQLVKVELPHGRPEPMRGFIFNTRRPLFADVRVRKALSYVFDFGWINKALYGDIFKPTASYYPNSELAATGAPTPAEVALLTPYKDQLPAEALTAPFTLPATDGSGPAGLRDNLRTALSLLEEAGWSLKGGQLVNAAGQPFTFEILIVDPFDQKPALEFSRTLQRLGIVVRIRLVESAQYQSRLNDFDFDMTVNFWTSTLSPGNEQLFYWGSKAADQPGSRNYAGVKSAAIDALADGIARTVSRAALVTQVRALDRALLWGYYAIPMGYLGRDLIAYWQGLERPAQTPTYGAMPEQTWWAKEPR